MYTKTLIIVLLGLMVLFQGCHTAEGVTKAVVEGVQEDWKDMNAADGWVKTHLW